MRDMELAGATWVQIGTAFFRNNDYSIFGHIAEAYVNMYETESV